MKQLLTIAFIAMLSVAHAQKLIGVRGGLNVNNFTNTNISGGDKLHSLQSFHAGITANVPFLFFSLQPSVLVSSKGAKVTHGDVNSGDYFVAQTNPMYLEVPATFNLNVRLGAKTGVFIGLGPYAAWGIGGNNKVYGKREGAYFQYDRRITYNDNAPASEEDGAAYGNFHKFDYGIKANAGVFLAGIMLSTYYDLGLAQVNTMSNPGRNDHFRNSTFGISAGILFGGDK